MIRPAHNISIRQFMTGSFPGRLLQEVVDRAFSEIRRERARLFSPQNQGWTISEAHHLTREQRIALSSDHAGAHAKAFAARALEHLGVSFVDFGPGRQFLKSALDFPIWAVPALEAFGQDRCSRAILACGSGTGVMILANSLFHRAVKASHPKDVVRGREHNDIDVLTVGERMIADREVGIKDVVKSLILFLSTPFIENPARYRERLFQIGQLQLLAAAAPAAKSACLTEGGGFESAVIHCPELADIFIVKAQAAVRRGDYREAGRQVAKYTRIGSRSRNFRMLLSALRELISVDTKAVPLSLMINRALLRPPAKIVSK